MVSLLNHEGTKKILPKTILRYLCRLVEKLSDGAATEDPNAAEPQPKPEMSSLTQRSLRTPRQEQESIPPILCGLCERCVRHNDLNPDFVAAREDFDLL